MRKLTWIQRIYFLINIVMAIFLGMSIIGTYSDPETGTFFYLQGLFFPVILAINVFFVFLWVLKRKIHFVLSLLIILAGFNHVQNLVGLNFGSTPVEENPDFTLMSINVRLFNQYKWIDDEELPQKILAHIQDSDADIIAIQEFVNYQRNNLGYIKKMKALGYKHYIGEPRGKRNNWKNFFGLIIFSKYKILNHGTAFIHNDDDYKTASLYADIETPNGIVRIYNTHLNSLKFITEDYQFVENITQNNEEQALEKSKNIVSKVLYSAGLRKNEVNSILDHVKTCEHPYIIAGDFNEPPYLNAYSKLSKNLKDPFLTHGFGLGTTYDGIKTLPGLRLDYLLHPASLKSSGFHIGPPGLSDHRSLYCAFSISE